MKITATRKRIGTGVASLALLGGLSGGMAIAQDGAQDSARGTAADGSVTWQKGSSFGARSADEGLTAQAAKDCPKGWLCVWSGKNYTGRMQKVAGNNKDLSRFTVFAKGSKSGYNHGASCDVKIYQGKNYKNLRSTVPRNYKNTGATEKILSNKWVNCR